MGHTQEKYLLPQPPDNQYIPPNLQCGMVKVHCNHKTSLPVTLKLMVSEVVLYV